MQYRGSSGALLYAYWYQALLEVLFVDALGPELFARLQRARYPVNHAIDRLMLDDADSDGGAAIAMRACARVSRAHWSG